MVDLIINNKNARMEWGIVTTGQTLSALLAIPPMKERPSFNSRLEDGTRRDNSNPRIAERSITLEIQMTAKTVGEFYNRYELFCKELSKGEVTIFTTDRPWVVYHMQYDSCSQYTQFIREYAILSLKLTEPDPTNRSYG